MEKLKQSMTAEIHRLKEDLSANAIGEASKDREIDELNLAMSKANQEKEQAVSLLLTYLFVKCNSCRI